MTSPVIAVLFVLLCGSAAPFWSVDGRYNPATHLKNIGVHHKQQLDDELMAKWNHLAVQSKSSSSEGIFFFHSSTIIWIPLNLTLNYREP